MHLKGFTLVEVLVAIAVASILGAAIITLVLQSQAGNTSASLRNQGTNSTEEVMEKLVAFRNYCGWDRFTASGNGAYYSPGPGYLNLNTGCVFTLFPSSPNCPNTSGTLCFEMRNGPDAITKLINVYYYYSDRGKTTSAKVSRYLSKY